MKMNSTIDRVLKSKITKHIAFAIALFIGIMLVFYVIAVDIYGARSLAGLAYMHSLNDKLCDYRTSHGEYPPGYTIDGNDLKKRNIKNFAYTLQSKSNYEIQFTVSNIFRGDTYLRGNTEGVFIKDGPRGDWRRWFSNDCSSKAAELKTGNIK